MCVFAGVVITLLRCYGDKAALQGRPNFSEVLGAAEDCIPFEYSVHYFIYLFIYLFEENTPTIYSREQLHKM
jgi:hypothetical protein